MTRLCISLSPVFCCPLQSFLRTRENCKIPKPGTSKVLDRVGLSCHTKIHTERVRVAVTLLPRILEVLVRISAEPPLFRSYFFRSFPYPSKANAATIASFRVFSNSSFIYHPTIRPYVAWLLTTTKKLRGL
jgi:hypothetical protein